MSVEGSNTAVLAALAANLGIAVAKLVGFFVTGASSMLAESVHSFADSGNQGLLLLGGRRARRAPDAEHQFGYGRERYFWSFVVALVLFSLGSLFAIYEGIHKIQHPEPIEAFGVAVGILLLGVLLEGGSLMTAVRETNRVRGAMPIPEFIRRAKTPELPVVLLEDAGAMAGLVIALGAVGLARWVDPVWDGIGTVTIGVLLGVIAVILAIEMKSLLIGESADVSDVDAIRGAIASADGVEQIIHLRTEHIGPDRILVAVKVAFSAEMGMDDVAAAIDRTEAAIRARVVEDCVIYIEPDLMRSRSNS